MKAASGVVDLSRRYPRRMSVLALALLAAGSIWAVGGNGEDHRTWHRVTKRDLVRAVSVDGELAARHAAEFKPPAMTEQWNFKIASMASEGSEVSAGDIVLAFDDSDLRLRLQQAIADRDKARKTLEKRRTDLAIERRNARLRFEEAEANVRRAQLKVDVPSDLLARNELDIARIDLELAHTESHYRKLQLERTEQGSQAELEALEQHAQFAADLVQLLQEHLERMNLRTDRPGTVIYRSNWQGEKHRVGDTVWREEVVLSIPDLSSQIAIVEVDEGESSRVALGQRVALRLDAHPDRSYGARVAKIHRKIQRRSWRDPRRIVRVELELDAIDTQRMRPGMRLTGKIEVERIADVLAIPLEAVVEHDQRPAVLVRSTLGEHWAYPELGRRNRDWVEIIGGLAAGDRVLLPSAAPKAAEATAR